MIVYADVGDVGRHFIDGALSAQIQESGVGRGVEGKQGAAVLEALGPLGPPARGVPAIDGEDGGAFGAVPGAVKLNRLAGGEGEELCQGGFEISWVESGIDFHELAMSCEKGTGRTGSD